MRRKELLLTLLITAACVLTYGCGANGKKVIEQNNRVDDLQPAPTARFQINPEQVRKLLQSRINSAGVPPRLIIGGALIYDSGLLTAFYERRNYLPAWSDGDGTTSQADAFINVIRKANNEGLRPDDYHLAEIGADLEEISKARIAGDYLSPSTLADLDLLMTHAFLLYASHIVNGRVNPGTVDVAWLINYHELDFSPVLETALDRNLVEETLKTLLPQEPLYARLGQALIRYRNIAAAGGWPSVPEGSKMERGYRGDRVKALRARLVVTGDIDQEMTETNSNEDLFDDELERAVFNFQRRHGLSVDGIVGPSTLAALNVPIEERIRQIQLNMERWRWLPGDLGERYILVNIADYELDVVEKGQIVMNMRVVVGKPYWDTPVFSAKMTHLVMNPSWNIPETIFADDILPKIREDSEYLSKRNIKVLKNWSAGSEEIDPATIDWTGVTEENFNYKLRQQAGPMNPLGQIKFMFPNRFSVYLHDTPLQYLFARARRNFSHGCIRIEKPVDLAEYVLRPYPQWTRKKIRAVLNTGVTQAVNLPESIPVYLVYFTAWVDQNGTVQFFEDIYGRDKALDEALRGPQLVF